MIRFSPSLKSSISAWPCLAAVLAVALLSWLIFPGEAGAHARLVSSDPQAGSALSDMPAQFRLEFNEAVDVSLSDVDLLDSRGDPVAVSPPRVDSTDPVVLIVDREGADLVAPGVYTLVWRVLSDVDGHVTTGSVPFSAGTGEAPSAGATSEDENRPPWWQVVPRWLELAGWVALTGIVAFGALNIGVLRTGLASGERSVVISRWRMVWFGAFGIALLGMVLGIWAQTLRVSGESTITLPDPNALGDVLAETSYGRGWIARLLVGALLLLAIGLFARLHKRWQWATLALLSLAALFTISRTGHAIGEARRSLAVATDIVHLFSASVWLGGLVALVVALREIARFQVPENARTAASLVRNHSSTSLAVMAVIIVTGVTSASFHVGGFRSLREEDYGVTLLSKQALLIVVLVAAAINLLVLRPRVFLFLRAQDMAGTWQQIRSIRYVAIFEVGVATLILLATAVLTVVAPADYPLSVDVAAKAVLVDERATAAGFDIGLLADLRGDPLDQYTVTLTNDDGSAPVDLQRLIVESMLAEAPGSPEGLGDRFDAEPVEGSPGTFVFPATRLGLEGEWTLNMVVRRAGVQDVEASFKVDTTGTTSTSPRVVEDTWRLPEMTLTAWFFVALAVVMMVVGLAGLRYLTGLEPIASGVLLAMCVLIAIGFLVSATRQTVPVSAGQDVQNPVEFGDVSIRQGSDLYFANCLLCHGAEGRGVDDVDSPHAHGEVADLTDRAAKSQTDGDLYTWVTEGVPGTDMPAFDAALTDEERWRLVNYIRWLQGERP